MKAFPTIHQIANAVLYLHDVSNEWSYNETTHMFIFTELIPYPVRDSGGSIDSIGYDESIIELTFTQAYNVWKDFDDLCHLEERDYPKPVAPYCPVEDDFELPF